ncbi:COX assembly mitochondrial protein [Haematococcus lacustris]|uniref:COX assembly mitochondrial protein n=1 Tax=Haematococcus lacustris TaxID=44745 RepID=A0A699ZS78_HAELA|nr:COX assembly mitochondrial protein [Haematococcus lacustris]
MFTLPACFRGWMPGDDCEGGSVSVTEADVRAAQAELDRVFGVTRRASTPSQALDQCENEALAMVKCMDQHRGPTWYWSCGRYYVTLQKCYHWSLHPPTSQAPSHSQLQSWRAWFGKNLGYDD